MPTTSIGRYTQVRGLVQTAEIRTATFMEREHLVVPVVALVGNSIIHSMNSDAPEFVPASLLSVAPAGWNGRPILPNHPNEGQTGANIPEVLERECFGNIFNAEFAENRLRFEAWIDKGRAAALGGDPEKALARCAAGEVVEVSIGAFVMTSDRIGVVNGKRYARVWTDLIPDHLAILPEGVVGACSVEAGCGTNRLLSSSGNKEFPTMPKIHTKFLEAFKRVLGIASAEEGQSDSDLRYQLYDALYSSIPAFLDIIAVYPDDHTVVYCTNRDHDWGYYKRSFTSSGDTVTLNDDEVEVVPKTEYKEKKAETAAAEDGSLSTGSDCQCHKVSHNSDTGTAALSITKEDTMSKLKELAGRLIGLTRSPFKEADRAVLESMSEDRLGELVEEFKDEAQPVATPAAAPATPAPAAPVVTPATPTPEPVTVSASAAVSEEQWMKNAPPRVRALVEQAEARETQHRTSLISVLASGQKVFNQKQLEAKDTADLESLVQLLNLNAPEPDYSARVRPTDENQPVKAPDIYELALAARRKQQSAAN